MKYLEYMLFLCSINNLLSFLIFGYTQGFEPQNTIKEIIGIVFHTWIDKLSNNELVGKIEELLIKVREHVSTTVNTTLLYTYMEIGRVIAEDLMLHIEDRQYKVNLIRELSKKLTNKYDRVFSKSNIYNMISFYTNYNSVQSLTGQLTWTHYCELISINDKDRRTFYEKECVNAKWSVRELKRQIASSLYERLLLSNGESNKQTILNLALKGNEISTPEDMIKDPYVFDFLGLPEDKPMFESDLERALVIHIEKFLLELGKGFMFVGTQQRVTYNNRHYYADMVFYNKILKAYVLIELKTTQLMPEAVGQLNMYLNYYKAEVNDDGDNDPIGIILYTDKGNVNLEYALGGLSNQIFASKYITYMPNKEDMIRQVELIIEKSK